MNADPTTGEVIHVPAGFDIVTLDIAHLDEDTLAQWAPSPIQAAGALAIARAKNLIAPTAVDDYRRKLKAAEREKQIALGLAIHELRGEYGPRATMTELRELAYGVNTRLKKAMDAYDEAWLLFEYAKDFAEAVARDVSILQSILKHLNTEIAA